MKSIVCFLALTFALAAAAPTTSAPPNGIHQCARSECPEYTLLEDYGSDMFKRQIEPGLWVYKVAPTCNKSTAVGSIYMDLHYYFSDNNISRTTPIVMEISENKAKPSFCPDQSDEFPCCDEFYSLSFFVPQESQATAPEPNAELGVYLLNAVQPRVFYGIAFSGRATNENVEQKLEELSDYLESEEISYEDDTYLIASYDSPSRPEPHRNEILIPPKLSRNNENNRANGGRGNDGRGNRGDRRNDAGRQRRELNFEAQIDLIPY